MPVAVYVSPTALTVSGPVTATVRVSSELTDAPVSGTVALRVPPGWSAEPAELPYALGPGGFTLAEVTVTPPPDAEPGRHWLAARLTYGGQTYEDVVALDVPGTGPRTIRTGVRARPWFLAGRRAGQRTPGTSGAGSGDPAQHHPGPGQRHAVGRVVVGDLARGGPGRPGVHGGRPGSGRSARSRWTAVRCRRGRTG